jgi:NADH-quinone oxidoreductase subunit H
MIDGPTLVFVITSLAKSAIVVGIMLGLIAYSVVAERRVSAWIQDRIGPNRVGLPFGGIRIGDLKIPELRLFGLGQPIADGLKFLLKEEYTPAHVNKFYFTLAPMLAMVPALLTVAVVPFGSTLDLRPIAEWLSQWLFWSAETIQAFNIKAVIADVDVGVLFVFAIVSISVYGIVLAGWSSNSKYPFLGSIRSSAQMISYEIAMGLSVVPVFLIIGNLNLGQIVQYQIENGWLALPLAGFWNSANPWESFILWLPLGLSFLIFLVAAFAETNRLPFDLPECETELIGGYHTEYSAMKFALFFLGEYAAMIVTSTIMVTLFFGGWSLPLGWFANQDMPSWMPLVGGMATPWWFGIVHIGVFMAKMACFIFFFIWVRWSLPRFRYDQLMSLGWKFFIPVGLANVLVTAGLVAFFVLKS